ncbi:MAG: riboflavin synthase [Rhodospirillaceae bacterium]|nr:riboflavin synthase [Rhodospirillaceae bacterium]OUT79960.1 MAG: riboflavin synthase [Rhodospirillaceae bacterium TMED23]|tara:strand:+ start:24837 stop:25424 length:588 start_codon:yes stop_codon:yes gene_type:complete
MFTGIISNTAKIARIEKRKDTRFVFETDGELVDLDIGGSVACSGVCLTAVEIVNGKFAADVSNETLSVTTLNSWTVGTYVNIERALRGMDELGGHLVSGHVDGIAEITSIELDGGSTRFDIKIPHNLTKFIAEKGSVCVDGVSLTVNTIYGQIFSINIIPHTLDNTIFKYYSVNDFVNIEIDLIARYVASALEQT